MQFRQILRKLCNTPRGKAKFQELLVKYRHRMTEREYGFLEDIYYKKLPILDVAYKYGLSISHFYCVLNPVLVKFETLLSDTEIRQIVEFI